MADVQCSTGSPCASVQVLAQRIENHDQVLEGINKMLEKIQNRPPVWASLAISGLAGAVGLLAGHVR